MGSGGGNLYERIGVSRNATPAEIERACLALAERYRPDREASEADAQVFAEIEDAYETLTDAGRRAAYDRSLDGPADLDSSSLSTRRGYPVVFTATAGEYFRIWIVNLALTFVTVGIYSAWAKVRSKRYLFGNVHVDGDCFEYRGNPLAILRGRLIAVAALVTYQVAGIFSEGLAIALIIAFAFVLPWVLVRSLAFNAQNTAYRNIRFHFQGRYGPALKMFAFCALLMVCTLGLAYPYVRARFAQFKAENYRYGAARFRLPRLTRAFYVIYLKMICLALLLAGLLVLIPLLGAAGFAMLGRGAPLPGALAGVFALAAAVYVFAAVTTTYAFMFAYLQARTANEVWNSLAIPHPTRSPRRAHFESSLRARDLCLLYAQNVLAIVLTLGLAIPWAVVRTLRYRAEHLALHVPGGVQRFLTQEAAEQAVGASGEELGEVLGFEFSL